MVLKNNKWMDFCMKYVLVLSPFTIQSYTITSISIENVASIPMTLIL
ncbi:MAG: hypothetical protein P8Y23_15475 [Candidatus Lokiarchaeota archaeon]|jgi:hypothetical protein